MRIFLVVADFFRWLFDAIEDALDVFPEDDELLSPCVEGVA